MCGTLRGGITFAEIAARWKRVSRSSLSANPERLAFCDWLTAPPTRAWFFACSRLAQGDDDPVAEACLPALGEYGRRVAEAHLSAAWAARHARRQQSAGLLEKAWEAAWRLEDARENVGYDAHADRFYSTGPASPCAPWAWSVLAGRLAIGLEENSGEGGPTRQLVDAAFRLLAEERAGRSPAWPQYLAEAWSLVAALSGSQRRGERLETNALVTARVRRGFRHDEEGIVLTLVLERIADGLGVLCPAPEMAFVYREQEGDLEGDRRAAFRSAEDEAVDYLKGAGLWDDCGDVRWTLRLHGTQQAAILRLTGPSAGAALGMGAAVLLAAR